MAEELPPETEKTRASRQELRERQKNARRVYLDPSSPSVRSIVRVVVVTLILLFVAGSVQTILTSLAGLFFMIVLSIFFAYLIDPIVKVIRRPFKERNLERLMPRSAAIVIAYVLVFLIAGAAIANLAPRVGEQAREFGTNIPQYIQTFRERSNDINRRFDRLRVPDEVPRAGNQAKIKP